MSKKTSFKILIIILLLFLISFSFIIPQAKPTNPTVFLLKRTQENLILNLHPTPSLKTSYYFTLQYNRFEDLKYVTKNNYHKCILTCSQRYYTTTGNLTEHIIKNNQKNLAAKAIDTLQKQKEELQSLLQTAPKTSELKYIEDSINYLDIFINQLKTL